jgi:hypothetical protein
MKLYGKKEYASFVSNLGEGIGCIFISIGLAILVFFPPILGVIKTYFLKV